MPPFTVAVFTIAYPLSPVCRLKKVKRLSGKDFVVMARDFSRKDGTVDKENFL